MKKLYLVLFLTLLSLGVIAQVNSDNKAKVPTLKEGGEQQTAKSKKDTSNKSIEKENLRTAEDLKSGNYKDVLTSFMQLAAKDLTGENKSFAFSTTLFAMKLKSNPNLLIDTNFRKARFSRNFQFNFKINLDSSYNFKGFSAGVNYAIINGRDRQLANFNSKNLKDRYNLQELTDTYFNDHLVAIRKYLELMPPNTSTRKKDSLLTELQIGLTHFNRTGKMDSLPKLYVGFISAALQNQRDTILARREAAFKEIDKAWLWTVGINGNTNKASKLNSGSLNTVLLKGLSGNKGSDFELDLRGAISYADTLVSSVYSQVKLKASGGVNIRLARSGQESLLEFKPHFEYNRIWKDLLPDEHREFFSANAEVRVRITQSLWIPVTVKYDLKEHNFLGFLNVSLNMDAFK